MGCWDIYCPLCGLPLLNIYFNDNNIKINKNAVKWLEKCTILLPDKNAKHNFIENECNISFKNTKNKKNITISDKNNDYEKMGIVLHTDCWKYVKKVTNHKLIFDDFNFKKISKSKVWKNYLFKYLKYNLVKKYQHQLFDINLLYKRPNDLFILYSPLNNNENSKKNAKRIDANIKLLFKNKPKKRNSPLQSATIFKRGTIMKGGDGNNYIVKLNKNKIKRWVIYN